MFNNEPTLNFKAKYHALGIRSLYYKGFQCCGNRRFYVSNVLHLQSVICLFQIKKKELN